MGIEPTRPAWKAGVLPLNYIRAFCDGDYYSTPLLFRQGIFCRIFPGSGKNSPFGRAASGVPGTLDREPLPPYTGRRERKKEGKAMGMGIVVCGLNGAGKSTLGRALAARLRFHYIDAEDLFFPKTDPGYLYASPRPRQEAESFLLQEVRAHENFVLAAVKGDYGEAFLPFVRCALWVRAPWRSAWGGSGPAPFKSLGRGCCPGETCMSGKGASGSFAKPGRRAWWRDGSGGSAAPSSRPTGPGL